MTQTLQQKINEIEKEFDEKYRSWFESEEVSAFGMTDDIKSFLASKLQEIAHFTAEELKKKEQQNKGRGQIATPLEEKIIKEFENIAYPIVSSKLIGDNRALDCLIDFLRQSLKEVAEEAHLEGYIQGRLKCLQQHDYVFKPDLKKELLSKLPKESPYKTRLCQNRNGLDYCCTCEQAYEYCSCPARNTGFNSALQECKKIIENLK